MIKNILYSTDINPYSSHVLSYVMDIAERFSSLITVVHAIEPRNNSTEMLGSPHGMERFRKDIAMQVREAVEDDMRDCERGNLALMKAVCVEFGSAVDVILQTSRREAVDLIVLGSHSYSDERRLLGSVIQPVLMSSRVPVVVVPMPQMAGIYYSPSNTERPPAS